MTPKFKIRFSLEVEAESESGLQSVESFVKNAARAINQNCLKIKIVRLAKSNHEPHSIILQSQEP